MGEMVKRIEIDKVFAGRSRTGQTWQRDRGRDWVMPTLSSTCQERAEREGEVCPELVGSHYHPASSSSG